MTKKMKKRFYRIAAGGVLFGLAILLDKLPMAINQYFILAMYLTAYLVIGGDVVKKAVMNIGKGQLFDENFLMTIATAGAFIVKEHPEAVAVMLFYQIGELFQSYAVNKSRKSIAKLMDIRPDYANVKRDDSITEVDPSEVHIGETILVKPGEKVPLDGVITEGGTTLDTKALTGESLPREALVGDEVISGCINMDGAIEVKVTKEFGESTVSKILDLVENASSKKAEAENFITKFARYYTPVVVACAVLLAVLPPLILADGEVGKWIYRALTFLVISCPCALVISIPLSFFGGLGGASKKGILIKGSNYLEQLAKTDCVVFDKTGTLTKGVFKVISICPEDGYDRETLLELTAHAESMFSHPIAISLKQSYEKELTKERVGEVKNIPGYGIDVMVDGFHCYVGNQKFMEMNHLKAREAQDSGTIIHVAQNDSYLGYIVIADEIKEDAASAIEKLKNTGINKVVMFTGDRKKAGEEVAKKLGITTYFTEMLPGDKVERVEKLLAESKGGLMFVGDGINDAPVLARADIGIAMGGLGSDAAIEAADVVIMTDELEKIATGIRIARKTLWIVRQNIVFAIGIKVFVLLLAAVGVASMWLAVFADVGVTVIAVLNAIRALHNS